MSIRIHNNIAMMNAGRQYKVNTENKAQKAEKLSSGYQINRAADDAAGLQISEKMRRQIRGLNRGAKNGQDGISMIQVADGALEEVHSLLHRMRELTIQSLNDTNTEEDCAACQMEFDALQSEIDRITQTTEFNRMSVFDQHTSPYYQNVGNIKWDQSDSHIIDSSANTLEITYRSKEADAPKTMTITVSAGVYTTQELMDEIDDSIIAQGLEGEGINVEFTRNGTCNLNLENGESIDGIGGGLSYLFYKVSQGGSTGALIGTTIFVHEYAQLEISAGNNDQLMFDIEALDGTNTTTKTITIPEGRYTRQELIDYLNNQCLTDTDVKASEFGTGIRLEGSNSIVTGFKGNMFKIDGGSGKVYSSVFYDNVSYGRVTQTKAKFTGGAVKLEQGQYSKYKITDDNNKLCFQANGATTPTEITIANGEYTVAEMVSKLNELFEVNNLQLEAEVYPENSSGGYQGIQIISQIAGKTSDVGLDVNSTAFETLFKKKEYTYYGTKVRPENEANPDKKAEVIGAKVFSSTNLPLEINASNNQFNLILDGQSYGITLTSKDYDSIGDIITEINNKLNNGDIGYKDKVEAVEQNGRVVLQAKDNSIHKLEVGSVSNNNGYDDIFVKTDITYRYDFQFPSVGGTVNTAPSVTIPTDLPDASSKYTTAEEQVLTIDYNGNKQEIKFSAGTEIDQAAIIDAIKAAYTRSEEIIYPKFTAFDVKGSTTDNNKVNEDAGYTREDFSEYESVGETKWSEGVVGVYDKNVPATIKMRQPLAEQTVITAANNQLKLEINGKEIDITLGNGTYTRESLVQEIQRKVNTACGTTEFGGVQVSLDGQYLVFKARLNKGTAQMVGADTSIKCDPEESSFLKELHTVEDAASVTINLDLQDTIEITDSSNTFVFKYKENNIEKEVSLTLTSGTYNTREELVAELNKQLTNGGHGVTASLSGTKLTLTTTDKGSDTRISYNSRTGGTATEALFGELIKKSPAEYKTDTDIQEKITIAAGANEFKIKVNGEMKTVYLDAGTYQTRDAFVEMLDEKLQTVGVKVELEDNKLKYTSQKVGMDATIGLKYEDSSAVMEAIYGSYTKVTPGINASFDTQGNLILEGTDPGDGSIKVEPTEGFLVPPAETIENKTNPTSNTGYVSTTYASITSVDRSSGPITINEYNDELKFNYYENGNTTQISIKIDQGDYSLSGTNSIIDELQGKIDTAMGGAGKIIVKKETNSICIQTMNPGSNYRLESFEGDFYDKVLCYSEERTSFVDTKNMNGVQTTESAYIVGRKDIRNATTRIRQGINETLSLDLTYGNTTKTLSISLDTGDYSGTQLVQAIQDKLNEKLTMEGLPAGMIVAQIGGVNTPVAGVDESNVLVFKLSETVPLPTDGQYIIDGVKGSAAFTMFYQTEGEMEPAHVKGNKDISQGVTILPGETEMSFTVDGTEYQLDVAEGDYTADELLAEINAQLQAGGAPVLAEMEDGMLKISYQELGKHTISDIKGLAKDELFFSENGSTEPRQDIKIHLSANANDSITVEKHILNTSFLKINSCGITKPKYANKALGRIDDAINMVSAVRSALGSAQNRLSHAIANNQNAEENTVAAESRIRDTDMAATMVEFSRSSILEQVSQAMMAQARDMNNGILRLLE